MRYQVFISSTYIDLVEERSAIVDSVLKLDCFPAGMELFPAANEEQFEYIKSKIDESDYYVLVIGGRYGSVDDDGISYTEKEYDYAVATKKAILVFIHNAPMSLPMNKSEIEPAKREKLEQFKKKASDKRLIKQWDSAAKLSTAVVLSLTEAFERYPGKSWVRQEGSDNQQLKDELAWYKAKFEDVEKELESLKKKYQKLIGNGQKEAEDMLVAAEFSKRGGQELLALNYAKSAELYSGAIELEPNNAKHYNDRGFALYLRGEYNEAFEDINKAIELAGGNASYYNNRIMILRKLGRHYEASQDENKVKELRFASR